LSDEKRDQHRGAIRVPRKWHPDLTPMAMHNQLQWRMTHEIEFCNNDQVQNLSAACRTVFGLLGGTRPAELNNHWDGS